MFKHAKTTRSQQHVRSRLGRTTWGVTGLALPLLVLSIQCGPAKSPESSIVDTNKSTPLATNSSSTPKADQNPSACEAKLTQASISSLDCATLGLRPEECSALKRTLYLGFRVSTLADLIETELRNACDQVPDQLGAPHSLSAPQACENAIKALQTNNQALGANAQISVSVKPGSCSAIVSSFAKCQTECDQQAGSNKVTVSCQGVASCTGLCKGLCEQSTEKSSGKCAGQCDGTCDGTMKGTCDGVCRGECKGTWDFSSEPQKCTGQCKGICQGELACNGIIVPANGSPECTWACGADAIEHASCSAPNVQVSISGTSNPDAAQKRMSVFKGKFNTIVATVFSRREQLEKLSEQSHTIFESSLSKANGVQGSTDPKSASTKCVQEQIQAALLASKKLKPSVSLAEKVYRQAASTRALP